MTQPLEAVSQSLTQSNGPAITFQALSKARLEPRAHRDQLDHRDLRGQREILELRDLEALLVRQVPRVPKVTRVIQESKALLAHRVTLDLGELLALRESRDLRGSRV
jgi:hypothetical protein